MWCTPGCGGPGHAAQSKARGLVQSGNHACPAPPTADLGPLAHLCGVSSAPMPPLRALALRPPRVFSPPLPPAVMNGGHSPTAVNGAPSTPSGFSNGPATSSTASLSTQHLPPACGARQLSKLKRFLTTLQQFGTDISPEIGERVRTLVLGLVVSGAAGRAGGLRGRAAGLGLTVAVSPRPERHAYHRGVPFQASGGHQLPSASLRHPLPEGEPASPSPSGGAPAPSRVCPPPAVTRHRARPTPRAPVWEQH